MSNELAALRKTWNVVLERRSSLLLLASEGENDTRLIPEITLVVDSDCLVFVTREQVIDLHRPYRYVVCNWKIEPSSKRHGKTVVSSGYTGDSCRLKEMRITVCISSAK